RVRRLTPTPESDATNRSEAPMVQLPARPLVCAHDADLLDDLLRLAAAGCVGVDVPGGPIPAPPAGGGGAPGVGAAAAAPGGARRPPGARRCPAAPPAGRRAGVPRRPGRAGRRPGVAARRRPRRRARRV